MHSSLHWATLILLWRQSPLQHLSNAPVKCKNDSFLIHKLNSSICPTNTSSQTWTSFSNDKLLLNIHREWVESVDATEWEWNRWSGGNQFGQLSLKGGYETLTKTLCLLNGLSIGADTFPFAYQKKAVNERTSRSNTGIPK